MRHACALSHAAGVALSVALMTLPTGTLATTPVVGVLTTPDLKQADTLVTRLIGLRDRLIGEEGHLERDRLEHIKQVVAEEDAALAALLPYLKLNQLFHDAPVEDRQALLSRLSDAGWHLSSTLPTQIKLMDQQLGGVAPGDAASAYAIAGRGVLQNILAILAPYVIGPA